MAIFSVVEDIYQYLGSRLDPTNTKESVYTWIPRQYKFVLVCSTSWHSNIAAYLDRWPQGSSECTFWLISWGWVCPEEQSRRCSSKAKMYRRSIREQFCPRHRLKARMILWFEGPDTAILLCLIRWARGWQRPQIIFRAARVLIYRAKRRSCFECGLSRGIAPGKTPYQRA